MTGGLRFVGLAVLASLLTAGASAGPSLADSLPATLSPVVMTQNMDEASDFGPLLTATSRPQLVAAVTSTYQEVQASNIPARAAGIADEILVRRPTLIGLQEVSQWRTVVTDSAHPELPAVTTIQFDQLKSLMDALAARGLAYQVVSAQTNLDVTAPSTLGFAVGFTDRDVVLARSDLPASLFLITNVQAKHYVATLTVPSVVGPIASPRSWISVDAVAGGTSFRFLTTHLEPASVQIQLAQASELVDGPANTALPVILAGDLNSAAVGGPSSSAAYERMLAAGFNDAWNVTHPAAEPGFTWPLHGEDPYTSVLPPALSERIDLVLVRNNLRVLDAERLTFLMPDGLWPSDHTAVAAGLLLLT
jgi:endonuclease/exonuclease/phosphatase family metal-dependent hydrolase